MDITINYIAVLAAAVASMAIGFAWYSPFVLGKPWMKLKGYSEATLKAEQKKMGPLYGLSFVVALITAYVLYYVMLLSNFSRFPAYSVETGLITAFWMWLGFMMPVQITATIFGDKKWQLFAIDTGFQLVSILAMGAVIGFLG